MIDGNSNAELLNDIKNFGYDDLVTEAEQAIISDEDEIQDVIVDLLETEELIDNIALSLTDPSEAGIQIQRALLAMITEKAASNPTAQSEAA